MSSESSSDDSINSLITTNTPIDSPAKVFVARLMLAVREAVKQAIGEKSGLKRKRSSKNSENYPEIDVYSDGEEVEVIPYKKPPPVTVVLE